MKEMDYIEKIEDELGEAEERIVILQAENEDLEDDNDKLMTKIYQAYQVLGVLAEHTDIVDSEMIKALDYFSDPTSFEESFTIADITIEKDTIEKRLAWVINNKASAFTEEELSWLSEPLVQSLWLESDSKE